MNPEVFVFNFIVGALIALVLVFRNRNSNLKKENSCLKKKNYFYRQLIQKSQLKNFISTVNSTELAVFDFEVRSIIRSYFALLLHRIDPEQITYFLEELAKLKSGHVDILKECLVLAIENDEGVFGAALSASFENKEDRLKIEQFLDTLPALERKTQYRVAIELIQEKLTTKWYDHPLSYQKMVKEVIVDFENKIKDI